MNEKILITGALGQIGSDLTDRLRILYGAENVIATDLKDRPKEYEGLYETLNVMDFDRLDELVEKYNITTVYHLASLLSGTSEKIPLKAWDLNVLPLIHILELAKEEKIKKIFWPSSIAVFGKDTPKENTSQYATTLPDTVYGVSKVAGENWCHYYHDKYGVDIRSIRHPGLISWKAEAGGGTTDYAVEIFYKAITDKHYNCFLTKDTQLPMLYMEDAIKGTIQLMQVPKENITVRNSYNLTGLSFTPEQLALQIQQYIPDFTISYQPDFRQAIADTWPYSIDDELARQDWNWEPEYDLDSITRDTLLHLKEKLKVKE